MKNLLIAAIEFSLNYEGGKSHVEKTLGERNPGPNQAGSTFTTPQTVDSIKAACDKAVEVDVGSLKFGECRYFRLPIPGKVGVVALDSLDQSLLVDLKDPKGTLGTEGGSVEVYLRQDQSEVDRSQVDYTMLVIGKEGEDFEVFTFHPGPVVPRPKAVNDASLLNKTVTVAEALKLGFTIGKLPA